MTDEIAEKNIVRTMGRQLSTSFSDLLLCASAVYVAHNWYNRGVLKAAIGLTIQGVAAFFGIFRFAMSEPEGTIIFRLHKLTSWLAAGVGVPLIAMDFCALYGSGLLSNKIAIFLSAVIAVAAFMPPKTREIATQAASGFSMLTLIILCILYKNHYGLGAGFVYVIAGLVFSSDGVLLGMKKVDLLHYALIGGNFLFMKAL